MAFLTWKLTPTGKRYPYAVERLNGKYAWTSLSVFANSREPTRADRKITTQKEANKWFRFWLKRGRTTDRREHSNLRQFLTEYRRDAASRKSESTQRTDNRRLNAMVDWFENQGIRRLDKITPKLIDNFKIWKRKTCGPVTVNRYLEVLRAALNVAVRWGLLDKNPAFDMKMLPARGQRQIRVLSNDEISKIRNEMPEPERTFCMLMIYAGLRRSECVWLENRNFDFDNNTITIEGKPEFSPKGIAPRTIPLHPVLRDAVRRIRGRHRLLFDSGRGTPLYAPNHWYKKVVPLLHALGIEHANLHSLRHTFVTRLVRAGVQPAVVMNLARHKDFKTTLKYIHINDEDLRKGILLIE